MTLAPDFRRFQVRSCVAQGFHTLLYLNLRDKTCNLSTISKMNARRIKDTTKGWEKKEEEKKEAKGYWKLNWLREGSDFHCDQSE